MRSCTNYINNISGQLTSPQEITDFIKTKHSHLAKFFEENEIYNEQIYNKIVDWAFSGAVSED